MIPAYQHPINRSCDISTKMVYDITTLRYYHFDVMPVLDYATKPTTGENLLRFRNAPDI